MRLAFGLLVAALAGCASTEGTVSSPATVPPLAGTAWLAEDIDGRGVIDRAQTTLVFTEPGQDATRISGSGGCNRYSSPVSIDDETIRFGALAATRRACPPALMDQEARFFAALARTDRFSFTPEGKLVLDDAAGSRQVVMVRTESPPGR